MDDQSFGRRHDGAYTWTVFDQHASPNTANSGILALPESASEVRVLGYPNPFATTFTLRNPTSQALYFEVFNSMGQRLGSLTLPPDGESSWVDEGPSGMRIFQAEGHVLKAFKRD